MQGRASAWSPLPSQFSPRLPAPFRCTLRSALHRCVRSLKPSSTVSHRDASEMLNGENCHLPWTRFNVSRSSHTKSTLSFYEILQVLRTCIHTARSLCRSQHALVCFAIVLFVNMRKGMSFVYSFRPFSFVPLFMHGYYSLVH